MHVMSDAHHRPAAGGYHLLLLPNILLSWSQWASVEFCLISNDDLYPNPDRYLRHPCINTLYSSATAKNSTYCPSSTLFIIQMRYLPRSYSSMPFPNFVSNHIMIRIPFFEDFLKVVEGRHPLDSCAVVKFQHQVCRGSRGPQSEIALHMASTCLSRSRQCSLPIRIDPSQIYS